jgi:heat shock protein HslJ
MRLPRLAMTWACCVAVSIGLVWAAPDFGQAATTPAEGHQDATAGGTQPSVVETQWNLVELNGSAVHVPAAEGQVYIYLQQDGDKLSGSDGCNRFFGSYDLRGASLEFHSVAQTMMACRGSFTDREAEFLDALKLVTSYQVAENVLQLKVDDRVLARFQARKK